MSNLLIQLFVDISLISYIAKEFFIKENYMPKRTKVKRDSEGKITELEEYSEKEVESENAIQGCLGFIVFIVFIYLFGDSC